MMTAAAAADPTTLGVEGESDVFFYSTLSTSDLRWLHEPAALNGKQSLLPRPPDKKCRHHLESLQLQRPGELANGSAKSFTNDTATAQDQGHRIDPTSAEIAKDVNDFALIQLHSSTFSSTADELQMKGLHSKSARYMFAQGVLHIK
jgi:hypothetical protein